LVDDGFPNNKTSAGIADSNMRFGAHDPTVVATEAPTGGLYLQGVPGLPKTFQKLDNGATTNWTLVAGGGGSLNIPINNTAYVNGAGNDATAKINNIALPFLSIAAAMAALPPYDPATFNQIILMTSDTFPVDGLNFLPNVFIVGVSTNSTTIDLGVTGITFDPSWDAAPFANGGFINVNIFGTTPTHYPFNLSSVGASGVALFFFQNCTFFMNAAFTGSNLGITEFFISDTLSQGGDMIFLNTQLTAYQFDVRSPGELSYTVDGGGAQDALCYSCCFHGGLIMVGSTGTANMFMKSGFVQTLSITGPTSTLSETIGVLPDISVISLIAGGNIHFNGDGFGIPLSNVNPARWVAPPPVNVQDAINRIANVVGNPIPIP
jgi:hypothetical protein